MAAHRASTVPGKTSGSFRLRQHYACSGGYCTSFKMYIIQKLKGSGGLDTLQDNSKLYQIDNKITKQMKIILGKCTHNTLTDATIELVVWKIRTL